MARKTLDRKALREEVEAAEAAGVAEKKTTSKRKSTKRKSTKRKSRSKEPAEVRVKLYWGVFNQSMKQVALYEHHQKRAAELKAKKLSQSSKSPHFVQRVRKEVAVEVAHQD